MMRIFSGVFVAFLLCVCGGSVFAADASLGKLDWDAWRKLPVYDEGRVMPLNTFSRIIVTRICGTNRPNLVLDDSLLEKIESLLAAKYGADAVNDDDCEKEAVHIRARLKELFPDGKRQFEAHELLFSWIAEPGVWDFVPLVYVKNGEEFRNDILISKSKRRIRYIAPIQLDTSVGYHDLLDRIRERQMEAIYQARQRGEKLMGTPRVEMSTLEATALELHNVLSEFRDLTFISKRNSVDAGPDHIDVDQVAVNFAASNTAKDVSSAFGYAMKNAQQAFSSVSRSWSRVDQQGLSRFMVSDDSVEETNPNTASETTRKISTFEKIRAIALLVTYLNQMTEEQNHENPEQPSVDFSLEQAEAMLEAVLVLTDQMLNESETLLETLYPEMQPEERKIISSTKPDPQKIAGREDAFAFRFSLVLLRRATQTAYLSLYQSGRTLQVLPSLCDESVRSDHSSGTDMFEFASQPPWVPLNLVLRGSPAAIRRFVDRDYSLPTQGDTLEDTFPPTLLASLSDPVKQTLRKPAEFKQFQLESTDPSDQIKRKPKETDEEVLDRTIRETEMDAAVKQNLVTNSTTSVRRAYRHSVAAYTGVKIPAETAPEAAPEQENLLPEREKGPRNVEWNGSTIVFVHSLRETADRMQPLRKTLLPVELSDEQIVKKTDYPVVGSLNAEFLYTRLDPFYWMGLTAMISLVCLVLSALLGFWRRILTNRDAKTQGENKNKSRSVSKPQQRIDGKSQKQKRKQPGTELVRVEQPQRTGSFQRQQSQANHPPQGPIDLFADPMAVSEERERFPKIFWSETGFFWIGVTFLTVSAAITFVGCALRSYISGWAPVSNMFETIVLVSFFAACLGLWFSLQPLFGSSFSRSWRLTAFPWTLFKRIYKNLRHGDIEDILAPAISPDESNEALKERYYRDASQDTGFQTTSHDSGDFDNCNEFEGIPDEIRDPGRQPSKFETEYSSDSFIYLSVAFIRVLLIVLTLGIAVFASYYESIDGQGLLMAVVHSFAMNDPIDWLVVLCTFGVIVWIVPRIFLTCVIFPLMLLFSQNPQSPIPNQPSTLNPRPIDRKVFVLVGALIVCFAAVATQMNPKEFNPNIRPLAAVLRSNFWLAVHVIAIMISYASGLIAWLLALASLGSYTFGTYRRSVIHEKIRIEQPTFCEALAPYIREMLKAAAWMLMIGTVLGARWADYSWGRFWSWDVKEVWALITLLVILGILHGRIARFYGEFGVAVGAILAAIAIIMTWYGFNFVFKVGRHAYGYGDSTWATIFMLSFIVLNIAWAAVAVLRFGFEHSIKPKSSRQA